MMNFDFFDALSAEDAQEHLEGFLLTEKSALEVLRSAAAAAGISIDYSLGSLPGFFRWMLSAIRVVRVPVPATEPEHVRQFHSKGLIEFTVDSKYQVLRAAYYLGESFVRANPDLMWSTGSPDTIVKNMPVVAGFQHEQELPPIMVCENLFGGIVGDAEPETVIDTMIDSWIEAMPAS